jgi:N-acetylmuramoyl-L-alanine amidase
MKANLPGRDRAVSQILLDLSQRATKNRSAAFAQLLLASRRRGDDAAAPQPSRRRLYRVAGAGRAGRAAGDGLHHQCRRRAFLTTKASRGRLIDAVGDSIEAYFSAGLRKSSRDSR